ncbi:glycosyltransferase [Paenibacillus sp. Soil787]|uniref:glycosyltransferase n=1 Tax=Paenibacillus sp. Soil787 TaxID=1736411 RepID=UPI000702A830|nr:glycosyltransferase [Paenibacillus sp. Soil787]KRF18680.1 hypothetical protein ASG93_11665 [Paenibacillus sp. Soil787]
MRILFHSDEHGAGDAALFARSLHRMLSSIGKVTYVDASQTDYRAIQECKYDVLIGMSEQFVMLKQLCKVRKSVWIAYGMHPRERNRVISEVVQGNQLSQAIYGPQDFLSPEAVEQAIHAADYVLCYGNNAAYNSYVQHGVPKWKIKTIHGGSLLDEAFDYAEAVAGGSDARPRIFTFASPEIGLRQGFELLYHLFMDEDISKQDIRLHVVGNPVNDYFANRINQLKSCLGDNMHVRSWTGIDDAHYANIMTSSDFFIYPTLDGGQGPTVLDALRRGTIPLLSSYAGVDFSPLGRFELGVNHLENKRLLLSALQLSVGDLSAWKQKSADYYKEYHCECELQLEQTLKNCIGGYLYPKVSVTLPIFNKENTIVSLLVDLDQALGEYPNAELHIVFDGCSDKSNQTVKKFFAGRNLNYSVTYETTPNIFEVKSNNIGLRKAAGEYCVILQDDNYILDRNLFFEAVNFLDKNQSCAVLGCLSGVNFYPRGTVLSVPGQTSSSENEVYWRQDANANPELKHRMFETDACMRGPLFIRKSFLVRFGYLDETYAPLYQDDMDLCFRARHYGWKVYCMLADVENRSLTMAHYDSEKNRFFSAVMKRNTDIFYARWNPGIEKDYAWIHRIPIR